VLGGGDGPAGGDDGKEEEEHPNEGDDEAVDMDAALDGEPRTPDEEGEECPGADGIEPVSGMEFERGMIGADLEADEEKRRGNAGDANDEDRAVGHGGREIHGGASGAYKEQKTKVKTDAKEQSARRETGNGLGNEVEFGIIARSVLEEDERAVGMRRVDNFFDAGFGVLPRVLVGFVDVELGVGGLGQADGFGVDAESDGVEEGMV